MKLIWYELRKIMASGSTWGILALCLCISLGYQWSETLSGQKYDKYNGLRGVFWESQIEIIEDMNWEEQLKWLKTEALYYGYLSFLENDIQDPDSLMEELSREYSEIDLESRIQQGENDTILPGNMDALNLHKLYNIIVERIEYIDSYPEFWESIQEKAKTLEDIALFSKVDGFSNRNIIQTALAYAKLTDLNMGYGYSAAIYMGTNTAMVDVMVLMLVLLFGWQIFCREREQGLYPLLRSAKEGRLLLIAVKAVAFWLSLAGAALTLYAAQILFGFAVYGVGRLDLALQSVSEYRNCTVRVTIGEYLLLFLGIKVLAALALGSIAMVFMTVWKSFVPSVCSYFAIIVAEYIAYTAIDSLSAWNWIKYVNLFAALDAKGWFTAYRNLNLFSNPFSAEAGKLLLCVGCILLLTPLTVFVGCRERAGNGKRAFAGLERLCLSRLPFGRYSSIFLQEGYKLYALSGAGIFLIILLAVSMRMSDGIPEYMGDRKTQTYRYYIEMLQGPYTEEMEKLLQQEKDIMQMSDDEVLQMSESLAEGEISDEEYNSWLSDRMYLIDVRSEGFGIILQQEQTIKEVGGASNMAGFADKFQLAYLFQDDDRQMILAAVLLVALILGISGLFGIEERSGMPALLSSTIKGRRGLQMRKLLQAVLCVTAAYLLLYLPYYAAVWRDMSRVDSRLVLNGVPEYRKFPVSMSVLQCFLLMVGIRYLTAIGCGILAAAVTKAMKNQALGSILCFLFLLLPCILHLWGVDLSSVSCTGGFLPELVYRNGRTGSYCVYVLLFGLLSIAGGYYVVCSETKIR